MGRIKRENIIKYIQERIMVVHIVFVGEYEFQLLKPKNLQMLAAFLEKYFHHIESKLSMQFFLALTWSYCALTNVIYGSMYC